MTVSHRYLFVRVGSPQLSSKLLSVDSVPEVIKPHYLKKRQEVKFDPFTQSTCPSLAMSATFM